MKVLILVVLGIYLFLCAYGWIRLIIDNVDPKAKRKRILSALLKTDAGRSELAKAMIDREKKS